VVSGIFWSLFVQVLFPTSSVDLTVSFHLIGVMTISDLSLMNQSMKKPSVFYGEFEAAS
jgi:hypothetical protein